MTVEITTGTNDMGVSSDNISKTTVLTEENPQQEVTKTPPSTENFFFTIISTIYDVIVFLAVSIGYICQVSFFTYCF